MTSRMQCQTRLNIAEARIKLDESQATFINFKTFQIMQQHIYYIRYALRFADMQISELVSVFNDQVQNRGWSSMRAYHDQALIDEFQRRGIDTTAVTGRKTISFVHPVRYDQFTKGIIYLLTLNANSVCIYKNEQPVMVAHLV